MAKRSYRKKSGRKSGKKGSRKGSKRTYRKKGSKKTRKASSKKGKRIVRRTRRKSPCVGLDEAECGYNPSCEYKTNKKGTKYCKSRAGTLYKKKLSKRLTKVQGPMGPPEGYVPTPFSDYSGDFEFNLPAMGYRIKKRSTRSKRHSKRKSHRKSHGRKGSKRHSKRKDSKRHSKRKGSKRHSKRKGSKRH